MLTVKWLHNDGSQQIYQAKGTVAYRSAACFEKPDHGPLVVFFDADDHTVSIDGGLVYVMNETGATVAKYVMASDEYPHGVMPE